jgi:hypothetical protein
LQNLVEETTTNETGEVKLKEVQSTEPFMMESEVTTTNATRNPPVTPEMIIRTVITENP